MQKHRWLTLFILFALLIFAVREWRVRPDGNVTVHMLDVGQGDSIFITGPSGQQIVVDGGPDLAALAGIGRHMSFFDNTIDLLILSHPHQDHLFAFPTIIKRYHVGAMLFTGMDYQQPIYQGMIDLLAEKKVSIIVADPQKDIDLGDGMKLDVIYPEPLYFGIESDEANNTSVIVKLTYGEDSMLFTGDMELPEENAVLASGADIRADILKVTHHGSKTSTSTGFLLAVDPELAVISVGAHNEFNHPSTSVIDRLKHFDIPTKMTSIDGEITIEMDGE